MSDKMRGALFNALGDVGGLTILDPFAGSGAISFEAASRGAAQVIAIEIERNAQRTISENTRKLRLGSQVKLIKANASAWLSTTDDRFDLVLCDPPYDSIKPELLQRLAGRCTTGGIVVLSLPPDIEISLADQFELLDRKDYGDASLCFYRCLN